MNQRDVETELKQAAESGNEAIVKTLLHNYREIDLELNETDSEINTPLYYCIKNDHLPIVKLIIDQEPSRMNLPCQYTFRNGLQDLFYPLFIATKFGSIQSFLYLLDMGANIEQYNGNNLDKLERTTLCMAAQEKKDEMVLILLKKGADSNNLVDWSKPNFPIRRVIKFIEEKVKQIEEENIKKELKELERRKRMLKFTSFLDLQINITNTC